MTQQEFFERTGVEVSNDEFFAIHEVYCDSELDKDGFCKMWCKMNPKRVKNAKVERKIKQRENCYRESLSKWFTKWQNSKNFNENWNTNIAYTKLTAYEVQAMSFAGIRFQSWSTLSDIYYEVGKFLGIFNR